MWALAFFLPSWLSGHSFGACSPKLPLNLPPLSDDDRLLLFRGPTPFIPKLNGLAIGVHKFKRSKCGLNHLPRPAGRAFVRSS
jgi:hypothetical protein